jgi:hypothetical protein
MPRLLRMARTVTLWSSPSICTPLKAIVVLSRSARCTPLVSTMRRSESTISNMSRPCRPSRSFK